MAKMYVNIKPGQTVRLRRSPSATAPVIINLPHGTLVDAQRHGTTSWHKLTVSYKGRHIGFMMSKYLSTKNPINSNPPPKPPENKYPIIAIVETRKHGNGGSLTLRKQANVNSEAMLSIQIGESIQVKKLQGTWLAAKYKGKEGYVLAKYIRNSDEYKKGTTPTPPSPPPVNKYPITTKIDSSKHGTGNSITLYSGPNENTPEKLRINNGENIQVAKLQGAWLSAKYGKNEGYVLAKYIQNSDEYKKEAPPKPPVNPYSINSQVDTSLHGSGTVIDLYETPSNHSKVLISIANAEPIQLKSLQGTWLAAKYKGKEGYVLGMYIKNAEQWKNPYPIQAYVDSSKHGTGHAITLYSNPQGHDPELAGIDNGKEIWLSRRDGAWLAVKYGQHTGFVEAKFVKGSTEYGKNPVQEYPILSKIDSQKHGKGQAVALHRIGGIHSAVHLAIPNGSSIAVKTLQED